MMNKNQYIENQYLEEEKIDFEKFEKIAKRFPKMFSNYKETEYGCPFDVISLTDTGGTYAIELKTRHKKYNNCFIEWDKFSRLRELWRNNKVLPIYICFYDDEAYMWVLPEVSAITTTLNVQIKPPKGEIYEADRVCLKFDEAYHFTNLNGDIQFTKPISPRYELKESPKYSDKSILETAITKYNYKKI